MTWVNKRTVACNPSPGPRSKKQAPWLFTARGRADMVSGSGLN